MGPDRIKGIKSCKPTDYVKISKLVVHGTQKCARKGCSAYRGILKSMS